MTTVTVPERKRLKLERLRSAVRSVVEELRAYARENGGRFVIFGSFARDEPRFDSDLDLMVDFPEDKARAAWFHAEEVCMKQGVPPDIHLVSESGEGLMRRVLRDGVAIE